MKLDDQSTFHLEWLHFLGSLFILAIVGAFLLRPTPAVSSPTVQPQLEARIADIRPTAPAARIARAIVQASEKCEIDPTLVAALMEVESAYRADAESHTGARGLMQLIRSTAESLGVRWETAYDIETNTTAGACYLARHLETYGGRIDLAARRYNGYDDPRFAQKVLARYRAISGRTTIAVFVRKGDTLASLASTYLDNPRAYRQLADENGITNPARLEPGQLIFINYA